jgi:hypothetical protein
MDGSSQSDPFSVPDSFSDSRSFHPRPTQLTPMPADRRKRLASAAACCWMCRMLTIWCSSVGIWYQGKPHCRDREIERINAGIDYVSALVAVFRIIRMLTPYGAALAANGLMTVTPS